MKKHRRHLPLIAALILFCTAPAMADDAQKPQATPAPVQKPDNTMKDYVITKTSITQDLGTKTFILDAPTRTIADFVKDYVDIPKGGTDWRIFAKTKEISVSGKTPDGYDYEYYKPGFAPEVEKLDGTQVTIKGFMFPLDAADKQKLFLFGPFPVSCPFHYHVSPALVIEVQADDAPVGFSYDAITLTGKLELVKDDNHDSLFYRLTNARQIKN